ncbi:GumC family protein [Chryseobacterium sp. TY4]
MNSEEVKMDDIDIRQLIKPYIKKWIWFIISVFILLCFAIYHIKTTAPVYKIQTTTLIKDAKKMSSASGDFGVLSGIGGFAGMGTNSIENELEIFKSKKLIGDVVKDLNIQSKIFADHNYYKVELYKNTSPIIVNIVSEKLSGELPKEPMNILLKANEVEIYSEELKIKTKTTFNKLINLPFANIIIQKNNLFNPGLIKDVKDINNLQLYYNDFDSAVNDIQDNLKVDLVNKDATIINMSINDPNREKAKDILNNIVRQYNLDAINDKNVESQKTKKFIDDRIEIISKELGEVENQRERFKVNNSIVDIPTEARINLQKKTEAQARQLDTDTQIQVSTMLLNYLNKQGIEQVIPVNIGLSNETASKSIELYNQLVIRRNNLLESATAENPVVREVENQIKNLRGVIKEGLVKHISSLNLLTQQLAAEEGNSNFEISKFPLREKLFRNIERQQQIKESLYLLLLQKREEAAISLAMTADKARVIDQAFVNKKLVAPKKMIILGGAVICGLLIPFALIYLKELLKNKIESKHDLEGLSTYPILSEIPRLTRGDSELIQMNDVSPMAEAFRILSTNLSFMLPKKDKDKIIFVTSTVKGEGKTFISVNLALSLASPKKKVLIIGSDIRNPQLQRYNPEKSKVAGLTEFLSNHVDNVKDIIHQSTFTPYCDIIYSGSIPPNPTSLLENGRYQILLEEIKDQYDYIILDTAPLLLVTDSFLISDFADATIYVTRSEVTERSLIDFANKNIENKKINNVAFVLNDVHKSNFGYGNKYGYGYQAEEKSFWGKLMSRLNIR